MKTSKRQWITWWVAVVVGENKHKGPAPLICFLNQTLKVDSEIGIEDLILEKGEICSSTLAP